MIDIPRHQIVNKIFSASFGLFVLSSVFVVLFLCPNDQALAGTAHAQPFYDETPCHQMYRAGWYLGKACAHARYNYGDDTGDRLVLSHLRKSAGYLEQSRLSCNLFFSPGSRANTLSRDLEHLAARLRSHPSPQTRQDIANILAGRFNDYSRALPKATIGGGPPGYCLEKYFRTAFLLEYAFNTLAYADNPEVGGSIREQAIEDGFRVLRATLRELRALDDLNASTGRCADLSSIVPYAMKARRSTGNIRRAYILARDAARLALDLTQVRCL